MNIKRIEAAAAFYAKKGNAALDARLEFFEDIWDIQARYADQVAGETGYLPPSAAELQDCLLQGSCATHIAPISVSASLLGQAAAEIAAYCKEHGSFGEAQVKSLDAADWSALAAASPIDVAGANPEAYLEQFALRAEEQGIEDPAMVVMIFSLALRPMLDAPAGKVAGLLKTGLVKALDAQGKSMHCPVCGGEPTASYVGRTAGNDGNAKLLWCGQCGTEWEFERVRCPYCGTHTQEKLHYLSVEGDDAHRAYCCDECGSYVRTVFVGEGSLAPFSFEVEDVVMADLDAAMLAKRNAQNN